MSLFRVNLPLHSDNRWASVFPFPSGILDWDVFKPKALSAWNHIVEEPSFLPPMNFGFESDKILLIHHSVQDEHLAKIRIAGIQALTHKIKEYAATTEFLQNHQDQSEIAPQARCVVDHEDIERERPSLGDLNKRLKPL